MLPYSKQRQIWIWLKYMMIFIREPSSESHPNLCHSKVSGQEVDDTSRPADWSISRVYLLRGEWCSRSLLEDVARSECRMCRASMPVDGGGIRSMSDPFWSVKHTGDESIFCTDTYIKTFVVSNFITGIIPAPQLRAKSFKICWLMLNTTEALLINQY